MLMASCKIQVGVIILGGWDGPFRVLWACNEKREWGTFDCTAKSETQLGIKSNELIPMEGLGFQHCHCGSQEAGGQR